MVTNIDREILKLHYTDSDNARGLALMFGDQLRYIYKVGWHVWNGNCWKLDDNQKVYGYVRGFAEYRQRLVIDYESDPGKKKEYVKLAISMESTQSTRNILSMAKATPPFSTRVEDIDTNPLVLNCSNGSLYLDISHLLPNDCADLITKCTGIAYKPDAKRHRWEKFLQEIFVHPDGTPDYDLIAYVQKLVGMSITGMTDRALMICYGVGANGKSTFFRVIQHVLGDYAASSSFNSLVAHNSQTGNELARLRGKRLVCATEAEESQYLNEAKVKQLTGGDLITCRFLYKELFEFYPEFTLWLAVNHKPRIRGTDQAIWDRIKLIPFNARFEGSKQDKTLSEKLIRESEGILAWMVEGCKQWLDAGRHIDDCSSVKTAVHEYRTEQDIFEQFLHDHVRRMIGGFLIVAELTLEYNKWAKTCGENQLSSISIGMRMKNRGYCQKVKRGSGRGYEGYEVC
jgi:putative DNA primase/helicase